MKTDLRANQNEIINLLAALKSQKIIGNTKRVGFTIPARIVEVLNEISKEGEKSRFVAEAIVEKLQKELEKKKFNQLVGEYNKAAKQSSKIAEEWFNLEGEAYNQYAATNENSS